MTYESTCPRCGAMLTSGGCLSCGYPNGGLRERTAADTTLAEKSKGDAPLGYVRYELLAEAWDSISKIGRELFDARTRIEELEAEIVNHESWLTTQQAATYAAEAERDEARRELADAEEAINALYHWAYGQTWTMDDDAIVNYVTSEMAHDAGDPSMVGSPVYGKVSCDFCLAESGEPWRDLTESNPAVRRALARNAKPQEPGT